MVTGNSRPPAVPGFRATDLEAERGSVTAEYAVLLPVIILCIALVLGASAVGIERIRVEEAARVAARMVARGDDAGAVARAVAKVSGPGTDLTSNSTAEFVEVTLSVRSVVPVLGWVLPEHRVTAYTVAENYD